MYLYFRLTFFVFFSNSRTFPLIGRRPFVSLAAVAAAVEFATVASFEEDGAVYFHRLQLATSSGR